LAGIYAIRHQFPKEYFVVGIEEFFDDGEDVLGMDGDGALFLNHS
jgi:hypothetical protein